MIVVEWTGIYPLHIPIKVPKGYMIREVQLLPGRNPLSDEDWEAIRDHLPGRPDYGVVRVVEEKQPEPSPPKEKKKNKPPWRKKSVRRHG